MKKDLLYEKLQSRLSEVAVVTPQRVGPFTSSYKRTTAWIKTWPVKILLPVAFVLGIVTQIIFGEKIVKIVSMLQWGF